jgi:hypothetical protein
MCQLAHRLDYVRRKYTQGSMFPVVWGHNWHMSLCIVVALVGASAVSVVVLVLVSAVMSVVVLVLVSVGVSVVGV